MKTALILFAAAIPAFAQQSFDFTLLDKLGVNAKGSTNINLGGDTLRMAGNLLGDGNDSVKSIVKNLKGVFIRTFEYEKPGQYDLADLAPLRNYLKAQQWTKIVDVKDEKETSEIYLQPLPNDKLGGMAIISAEAKEVSVVFIEGQLNMSDIGKLGGNLGIPDVTVFHGGKPAEGQKKD